MVDESVEVLFLFLTIEIFVDKKAFFNRSLMAPSVIRMKAH